ncbi:MAG: hypothetical protein LLG04_16795 [Parachlamydia sp.]|nr:hypothetical protein [Parachlamydia sp.]
MLNPLAKTGMRAVGFSIEKEGAALLEKYLTGPATKHLQNVMEHLAPGANRLKCRKSGAQNPKQYATMAKQHPQYAEAQRASQEAMKHFQKGSSEMGKGYVKMKANEAKKEVKDTVMEELEAHTREITAPKRKGESRTRQEFHGEERSSLQKPPESPSAAAELAHEAEGHRETLPRQTAPAQQRTDKEAMEPDVGTLLAQQAAEACVKPLDMHLRNSIQPKQEQGESAVASKSLERHKVDDISVLMPAKSVHAQLESLNLFSKLI